jgi:phenylalanyl-tRNA synthetase alpha chain
MEDTLKQIQTEYITKIQSADSLSKLDELFLELFGKTGKLTELPRQFSTLPKDQLKEVGPLFNKIKNQLENLINEQRLKIKEASYKKLEEEKLDLTPVETPKQIGHPHPLISFEKEIVDLFAKIGFQIFQSPEIDTDYFNYEVLNIPKEHPARDLWDTLYIDNPERFGYKTHELLLRSHTSNSQYRIMTEYKPPIRMMVLGRCYRYENLDARHEHTFDQFELVYVDKNLSMANLQYLSEYFLKSVIDPDIKVRLRPKYYPFVEPGVGIDGQCMFCKGKGCDVCGGIGWLELGGAGMIHPQVLKNAGLDPEVYSGIAWGPGLERILMLKYGIKDVRLFRQGDIRFLEKF